MPTLRDTFFSLSTVILYLEFLGLVSWLVGIIPTMLIDKVWRASQLLIGFHSIVPLTLYAIREAYKREFPVTALFPLFILISLMFAWGTDTLHLLGVVSEYHEFYTEGPAHGHSRSIYILQLYYASYFSLMNTLASTLIAVSYFISPRNKR